MAESIKELADELQHTRDPLKSLHLARRIRSLVDAQQVEKKAQELPEESPPKAAD